MYYSKDPSTYLKGEDPFEVAPSPFT